MPEGGAPRAETIEGSEGQFMTLTEIATRLLLAVALGALIGLDREARSRPAGLRTHTLTALAAAVFTIIALELYEEIKTARGLSGDPIRAIEAVTAGVAFLATGGIIHARGQVHGLTTGAAMWLAGAVGLACGAGYFYIALLATALALLILTVAYFIERLFTGESTPNSKLDR
jgi:putative Mg2+ transporter-C (MgtC) family protein